MSLKQLRDAYEGLGAVLKELTSNTTQWRNAQYATMFYEQLGQQIESLDAKQSDAIAKYRQIQQAGGEARLVYRLAKMDRVDEQGQRAILRTLYQLSQENIDKLMAEDP